MKVEMNDPKPPSITFSDNRTKVQLDSEDFEQLLGSVEFYLDSCDDISDEKMEGTISEQEYLVHLKDKMQEIINMFPPQPDY